MFLEARELPFSERHIYLMRHGVAGGIVPDGRHPQTDDVHLSAWMSAQQRTPNDCVTPRT